MRIALLLLTIMLIAVTIWLLWPEDDPTEGPFDTEGQDL